MAVKEIGEVDATTEDYILVDVEDGVSSQGRVTRNVAVAKDGNQEWGPFDFASRDLEGYFGVIGSGPERLGPERITSDVERDGGDG